MDNPDHKQQLPQKVPVRYQSRDGCSIFRADGATTSITPQAELQVSFYQSLVPFPTHASHAVTPEGKLGEIEQEQVKLEIIRDINAVVIINPLIAIQVMRTWQQLIDDLKINASEDVKAAIAQAEASKI